MKKTTKSTTKAHRRVKTTSKRPTSKKSLLSADSPLCQSLTKTTNCDLIILVAVLTVLCVFAWFYFSLLGQGNQFTPQTSNQNVTSKIDPAKLTTAQVSGNYSSHLPGADVAERVVSLNLGPSGDAEFVQRSDERQSILTQTGTWTLADGAITVSLNQAETLTFSVGAKTLTLINYDQNEWGTSGLTLTKEPKAAATVSDCAASNLGSCAWAWQSTDGGGDSNLLVPTTPGSFVLTFNESDGSVNIQTDCNNGRTTYALDGVDPLTFAPIISTQKFCQGSQETQFIRDLSQVTDYLLTQQNLALTTSDGKVMTFSAQ